MYKTIPKIFMIFLTLSLFEEYWTHPSIKKKEETGCAEYQFKCGPDKYGSVECVLRNWICDGYHDCADGSDEEDSNCELFACLEENAFKCKNETVCIDNPAWLCDGDDDCADGSDEDPALCLSREDDNDGVKDEDVPKEDETVKCPEVFSTADQLYCNGFCGEHWLDNEGNCQKSDADAYCKLKLCDVSAYAISFDVVVASNKPGFACDNYGTNYGDWLGIADVHFDDDIISDHGNGEVVTNVECKIPGEDDNDGVKDEEDLPKEDETEDGLNNEEVSLPELMGGLVSIFEGLESIFEAPQQKNETDSGEVYVLKGDGKDSKVYHLGCWGDNEYNRVFETHIYDSMVSIEMCASLADERGLSLFGIQYGEECWLSEDPSVDYKQYGEQENCVDGLGGGWSLDVYKIEITLAVEGKTPILFGGYFNSPNFRTDMYST